MWQVAWRKHFSPVPAPQARCGGEVHKQRNTAVRGPEALGGVERESQLPQEREGVAAAQAIGESQKRKWAWTERNTETEEES